MRLDGEAAVRHLFDVAGGLDSQALGEREVLGQVRRAYDAARAAGTMNRLIDTILSAALVAGRRAPGDQVSGRIPHLWDRRPSMWPVVAAPATARVLIVGAARRPKGC